MKYIIFLLSFTLVQCGQNHKPAENVREDITQVNEVPDEAVTEKDSTKKDTVRKVSSEPANPDPGFDTTQWAELIRMDPTIGFDLRYATENNFVGEQMYDCGRCFLRPDVARAVVRAHRSLQQSGMKLKMYDCYRPRPIQWKLWNKVPDPRYVADPRKGSMHNRGMAVDLTITDSLGNELDMGTDFDYFGKEAYHSYDGHPAQVIENRQLLLETMEEFGFRSTSTEWWHYSYKPKTFKIDDWMWWCP